MPNGGGAAENGEALAAIVVQIRASSDGARLSAIFQKSQENHGKSMCLHNDPFFLANRRLRIGQLLGRNHVHGMRSEMMPEMGHA